MGVCYTDGGSEEVSFSGTFPTRWVEGLEDRAPRDGTPTRVNPLRRTCPHKSTGHYTVGAPDLKSGRRQHSSSFTPLVGSPVLEPSGVQGHRRD